MDWEQRVDQCNRILEMCSEIDGDGRDFAESVSSKVESICAFIERNQYSTEKQDDALDNREKGCSKWLER
jgi:hypothetical protein